MLEVQLVAATQFLAEPRNAVTTDAEAAVEYVGRFSGSSLPAAGLLRQLIDDNSVPLLSHASATVLVTGISAGASRQVVAHPGFAVVERTVDAVVVPDAIAGDEELTRAFMAAVEETGFVHAELAAALDEALGEEENALARRKVVEEAVSGLLPAAREVELVITGSYAAWREFIASHMGEYEHAEVKSLAEGSLQLLREQAPLLVEDLGEGARR